MVKTEDLRKLFREYMAGRGYRLIRPDSLVSDTFPSCFTLSGGPNFVNRYLKQKNLEPENSVVIQPCHRFWDVGNVGDGRHLSFFEMAVTNSFNGIPREEMYKAHFDFLTKELGLNPNYFTIFVFGGGECYGIDFQPDKKAIDIWESLGLTRYSIQTGFGYSLHHRRLVNSSFVANTVEPVGGPRTEICYGDLEIWTSVLYNTSVNYDEQNNRFEFNPIEESTVAAGFGLERVVQAMNGLESIDDVSLSEYSSDPVIADHIRGLVFLAHDGAFELSGNQNSSRKTILNRYLRNFFEHFGAYSKNLLENLITEAINFYKESYPELTGKEAEILEKIEKRARRLNLI